VNQNLQNLLKISNEIDPVLGESLRKNLINITKFKKISVVNPDVQKFEERLQTLVNSLKSVNKDIKKALDNLDVEEIDEWFTKELDKINELDEAAERIEVSKFSSIASRIAEIEDTAGIKDWVKNKFKKKPKAEPKSEESESMAPSYQMDESRMDDFVEGKDDWGDASAYIEAESREKNELLGEIDNFLKEFKETEKGKPVRKNLEKLFEKSKGLIKRGEKFVKGFRDHLKEPGAWLPRDEEKSDAKPKNLKKTVEHYSDMLRENLGDEDKTIQSLREFFKAVGPMIKEEKQASTTSSIIKQLSRKASEDPSLRKKLIPVINLALDFNS
jgi:septum formation inhibitor MinC